MTQSEKRFFSRFATMQSSREATRYLKLFKAIRSRNDYNEGLLKEKFGARLFPQLKQQLQRKIFQSLRVYHSHLRQEQDLHNNSLLSGILSEKGFATEAVRTLQKNTERSRAVSHHHHELAALREQNSILIEGAHREQIDQHLKDFRHRANRLIEEMRNEVQYEEILLHASLLKEELETVRDQDDEARVRAFLNNKYLKDSKNARTPYAKMILLYSKGIGHYLIGDFIRSEVFHRELLELISHEKAAARRYHTLLIKALSNAALINIRLGRIKESARYIQLLNEQKGNEILRYRIYLLNLMRSIKEKEFAASIQHIEQNKDWVSEFEKGPGFRHLTQERVYTAFHLIAAYFGAGDHKHAAKLVRKFIQEEEDSVKRDAYLMARIINLVIHFELNNSDLLESELRSVHRMLRNEKKLYRFERIFLRFISGMQRLATSKQKREHFRRLLADLKRLGEVPFEKNAFSYFDFISWVEGKC